MTQSFDIAAALERPDPARYLRKREGSPGGAKRARGPVTRPRAAAPAPRAASPKPPRSSQFWRMYDRGDLPVQVEQGRHSSIRWTADLAAIDLHHYLPIFVDGLLETREPFRMLARRGVEELVAAAATDRLLPVIPQLVLGLRAALRSPAREVVAAGLAAVRQLVASSAAAGAALVPYYRQLLPPLASHVDDNLNIGDRMDYGQTSGRGGLGAAVLAALHALERGGGPDAFHHIKYHIPVYQSCLQPSRVARRA